MAGKAHLVGVGCVGGSSVLRGEARVSVPDLACVTATKTGAASDSPSQRVCLEAVRC